jgi:hypothetical protein
VAEGRIAKEFIPSSPRSVVATFQPNDSVVVLRRRLHSVVAAFRRPPLPLSFSGIVCIHSVDLPFRRAPACAHS